MQKEIDPARISQFVNAAERTTATVERIPRSANTLKQALEKAVSGEEKVLLAEPEFLDPKLFSKLRKLPMVVMNPDDTQLKTVKIGVTEAFAGVARTGSVCVSYSPALNGSISLFTRGHIAILDANMIVPRPRDILADEKYGLNRDFCFITGPSATADMGSIVRGVHGPGKLHIIILE